MTRRAPGVVLRATLLAAVMLAAACDKAPPTAESPRPVLTRRVADHVAAPVTRYTGEVRARYESALAFRVGGKVVARSVDAGAKVAAGQILARLDPADTALSLAAATAQSELAEADWRRFRELRAKNFVSAAALEARETAFKAARAQADLARNQGAYTVLRADHTGVITSVAAEVGQVVGPGQTVLRIARTDALEVAVAIPETVVADVRAFKDAEVTLWADVAARYAGRLRELSPVADAQTRTYAARIEILDPDARLALGMSASVRFAATPANAKAPLAVPLAAIFQQQGRPALWVVGADETVALRQVEVAAYTETTALLAGGVEHGERVVVAGVHKLSAGEKIRAVDAASAAADAAVPPAARR